MEKLKTLVQSAGQKITKARFAVGALAVSAAAPIISVAASAEGESPAAAASGLAKYSNDIEGIFTGMVDDVMPIAISVLTAGAVIFGAFIAWKLARKALGTVTK